jgi:phage terminase small subunit
VAQLTDKQRLFIEYYLQCFNATEAAKKAGYSEKTAYSIGWENLRKPEIAERIAKRISAVAMGAEEALARLANQARLDVGPFVDIEEIHDPESDEILFSGPKVSWEKLEEAGLTYLVKAVYWTKYGPRIEFHDPQRALELIGKHHGLFVEKQEISGAGGGPVQITTVEVVKPDVE